MDLPAYFLADLPPDAALTPAMITEAAQTLKTNRACYLAERPTNSLLKLLHDLGENWLDDAFPFRRFALEHGPAATGFSPSVLQHGLDQFFRQLNGESLTAFLQQDLGDANRLDAFVQSGPELKTDRRSLAHGPALITHVTAGTLPSSALQSMTIGLLARSAQFVKCARGASFIPRLFAHSIYDAAPKLGACLEVAEWKGGNESLEEALFNESEVVCVSGGDDTIAAVQLRLPAGVRLIAYGHKLSFIYIAKEPLAGFSAGKLIKRTAREVVAWDQQGCLSPHVVYVQKGPDIPPEIFAERLAKELAELAVEHPVENKSEAESAEIAKRRAFYEVRAAHLTDTRMWASEGSTDWTVVYDEDPGFQPSCLNRFIHVKAVNDLEDLVRGIEPFHGKISTVGLAVGEEAAERIATTLGRWGVTRLCPVGKMQEPPLAWRHDGRPALAELLTWTDWEQ